MSLPTLCCDLPQPSSPLWRQKKTVPLFSWSFWGPSIDPYWGEAEVRTLHFSPTKPSTLPSSGTGTHPQATREPKADNCHRNLEGRQGYPGKHLERGRLCTRSLRKGRILAGRADETGQSKREEEERWGVVRKGPAVRWAVGRQTELPTNVGRLGKTKEVRLGQ
jgi:hypothetical protein